MPMLQFKQFENIPDCESATTKALKSEVENRRADLTLIRTLSLATGESCSRSVKKQSSEDPNANDEKVFSSTSFKACESNVVSVFTQKERNHLTNRTFPRMIMRILSDSDAMQGIDWLLDGKTIAIVDRHHMESYVLPRFFDGISYENFIRLMNCWGFTKIADNTCKYELFRHELFQKDLPNLCDNMKVTHCEKTPHTFTETLSSNYHSTGSKKRKKIHIEQSTQKLVAEILTDMSSHQTPMISSKDEIYNHSEALEERCQLGTYLPSRTPSGSIELKKIFAGKTEESIFAEIKLLEKKLANIQSRKRSMSTVKSKIYQNSGLSKKDWHSEAYLPSKRFPYRSLAMPELRCKTLGNVSYNKSPFSPPKIALKSQSKDERAELIPIKTISQSTGKSCDYSKPISVSIQKATYLKSCTFPRMLMHVLSDTEAMLGIDWLLDGKTFAIVDREHMETCVLPHFFKCLSHEKFIRVIDCWGFTKVEDKTCEWEMFRHELFQKDLPGLCDKMKVTSHEKALERDHFCETFLSDHHFVGSKKQQKRHTKKPTQNSVLDKTYKHSETSGNKYPSRTHFSSKTSSASMELK